MGPEHRAAHPHAAHSAVEDVASAWLLDLLGLPTEGAVGFTTGATMANFTGLAAGRDAVLRRAGWDVARRGITGGPRVRVLVGAERHDTVDVALRYLGLGAPDVVEVDDQGRIRADALELALGRGDPGPTLVVLQAGNIHSGAFDPFVETVRAAHRHGAWVHVDGAFGLWAGASPAYRHFLEGYESADSWATDAHKTLNVPYDSGLCIVRDAAALQAAMGVHGAYLVRDETSQPLDKVPELSRRGRAIPVWAVLRCLGRDGIPELVERLCRHATAFADALRAIPGVTVLNDVVFTQVCATFGSDERTDEVVKGLLADGTTWMTGSAWHGQRVLRISVNNWSTTEDDLTLGVDATVEDQQAVLADHDVAALEPVEAVAIGFTADRATVRLAYAEGAPAAVIEADLQARLALAVDWPTTEAIGFADGFGDGAVTGVDGTTGELEYAVANPAAAANLALADLVPVGVCNEVELLAEPTGL